LFLKVLLMSELKRVAIMQPYIFPYLGYFQLAASGDIFVLYDNVNYIRQGYINRNCILSAGQIQRFVIPVPGASSFKPIKELEFSQDVGKVIKQIRQAYQNRPFFGAVFPLIEQVLQSEQRSIALMCQKMMRCIFDYLGMEKAVTLSSQINYAQTGSASDKIIAICHSLGADVYINSAGGVDLYDRGQFLKSKLDLKFIKMNDIRYPQGGDEFHPNLSIIDVLMNCSVETVRDLLSEYRLF